MADAPRFHWAKLRAACHPTEDLDRVSRAVRNAAGLGEDEPLHVTELEAHHGGTMRLVEATVGKNRGVREFLARILALPGATELLAATVERRTDDDGVFYFRLDKQEAFLGRLQLMDGEDAVQVRIRMETYPASREAAVAALQVALARGGERS